MRLWSLHPCYLDSKGLVALWREGLLGRKVLRGETKGYRHHPQLIRFRGVPDPVAAIDAYLSHVAIEAGQRYYRFDLAKIDPPVASPSLIPVTTGQLQYEWSHLLEKLASRAPSRLKALEQINAPESHPIFCVVTGDVEQWEVVKQGRGTETT